MRPVCSSITSCLSLAYCSVSVNRGKHHLIRHEGLDREAAEQVFWQQLSRPMKSLLDLEKHERVLFSLFGLQAFCQDRKAAVQLRNELNCSCLVRNRGYPVRRLADKAFHRVSRATWAKNAWTLYMFADLQCAIYRRQYPVLSQVAETVNVEIYPLSVYKGASSLALATTALCARGASRAERWRSVLTPSITSPENDGDCDLARRAVAVNDQAFRVYGFEGTPWIVDERGQAVPQSVVRDPAQLAAWLANITPEVAHE